MALVLIVLQLSYIVLNESLFSQTDLPNKVFAVTAEGGVLEEPRNELVVLDLVDVFLLEGALALPIDVTLFATLQTVGLLVIVGAHVETLKEFECLEILANKKPAESSTTSFNTRDFLVSPSPTSPSK